MSKVYATITMKVVMRLDEDLDPDDVISSLQLRHPDGDIDAFLEVLETEGEVTDSKGGD